MIRLFQKKPNKLLINSCYDSIKRMTLKENINIYGGFIDEHDYNKYKYPLQLSLFNISNTNWMWRNYNDQFNTISYLIDDLKINTDYGLIVTKKYNPILFFQNELFKYNNYKIISIDIDYFKHLYIINKQMKDLNLFYKYK
jgi:hypothetical protein